MADAWVDGGIEDNRPALRHVWQSGFDNVEERMYVGFENVVPLVGRDRRDIIICCLRTMVQDSKIA